MQEKIDNERKQLQTIRKDQKEMLEIKKHCFELIGRLETAKIRTCEFVCQKTSKTQLHEKNI